MEFELIYTGRKAKRLQDGLWLGYYLFLLSLKEIS